MGQYYDVDFVMEIIDGKLDEAKEEILKLKEEVPSAVVDRSTHGTWVRSTYGCEGEYEYSERHCSECGFCVGDDISEYLPWDNNKINIASYKYCPHCGALMT